MTKGENKTKQILIRVSPSKKEEWEEATIENDDNPYTSLAGAIRAAMQSTFFSEKDDEGEEGRVQAEVDMEPLSEKMDMVLNRIDSLERRVDEQSTKVSYDVATTAKTLNDYLYVIESESELPPISEASGADDYMQRAKQLGTASAWAEAIDDADEVEVRQALKFLSKEKEHVHSTETNGFTRYYKVPQE
ncbi:hypothetical protein ACAH01_11630 [Halomicrobium sp. HM KBTZ05]|uniref:hypothetical protein n=1 Tax=Halomicrobium sp. HM KBTZ05 TaxID=3242663 RepID=UPI0035587251